MNAPASQALVEHEPIQAPATRLATPTVPQTPMEMAYHLIQGGADLASVKEMLAMTKELAADQARREFEEAIALAKAEIQPVARNAKGHNEKRYADFSAYAKEVDPIITKYGLSYRFRTTQAERITVTCILAHKGGHFEENDLSGPADASGSKNAIQAIGSTLTYLQRYSLIQALGLSASNDDDGRAFGQTIDDGPIDVEQRDSLLRKIEETGTDISRFCAYFKIEGVADLQRSQYERAVKSLEKKGKAA